MKENYSIYEQDVLNWIDANQLLIVQFLQELIRIPSVTPWFGPSKDESKEAEVQKTIRDKLLELQAEVDTWETNIDDLENFKDKAGYYPDHEFRGRPNQVATIHGSGGGRSLLLTGHVDVVPAGEGWTHHPFSGDIVDDEIFGRGAVDMKGGLVAMIMVMEAIKKCGYQLKGDVLIGTVVDEEAGGMGTLDLVAKGYRADGCILTEPTNMKVAPLCRGILWGKLIIHGRSGHIELPQGDWRQGGAVDAIALARVFLKHFDRLNADWRESKKHPYLPIPCQLHVSQINGGEYPTAFANKVEIVFDAQYLPFEKDDNGLGSKVKKEIEAFINSIAQTEEWLIENPPIIEWLIDADCGETDVQEPIIQLAKKNLKDHGLPELIEGVCAHVDIGWFEAKNIPSFIIGAGNPRVAHQDNESIKISDLITLTKYLATFIARWSEIEPLERIYEK